MTICKDRVVIITGAGGGLGRCYALAFAEAGARVLVNDIDRVAADAVVAQINGQGGSAVANSDDITSYEAAGRIVRQALECFGDLHVLVNNAGICRDRMFSSLDEADWDQVVAVHLKGHFCLASHAVRYWRDQAKAGVAVSGRIINTSSGAGLRGSIGQSNYAAAKGGIAALTLVQAAELRRYGVTVNALAPAARTGMTEQVFAEMMKRPEAGFDHFAPENVAPLVVWLGSEASAQVSGQMFEVEGGRLSLAEGWRTGPSLDRQARWQVTQIGPAVAQLLEQRAPAERVHGS